MMEKIKKFEKMVLFSLVVMMAIVLLLSSLDLAWVIIKDIISPPVLLLDIDELLEIFGLLMLVLIGIELLETIIHTYHSPSFDVVQIIMSVAITAIARKVILLDVKELSGLSLLGIAMIILSLSIGYYLTNRKVSPTGSDAKEDG